MCWFVDETYVEVNGAWRYVYRAIDQYGQIIDVLVSARRDMGAARRFFSRALQAHGSPAEVTTDKAHALALAVDGLVAQAWHASEQYANNRIESDHARLKARLRPMRGLKRDRSAQAIIAGHAFIQNLRRGHYELGTSAHAHLRIAASFDELTHASDQTSQPARGSTRPSFSQRNRPAGGQGRVG